MRPLHRPSAFLLFAILVLGCGKKAGPDANPTPEPNPTPGGQPPAGSPGIEGTYLIVGGEFWGEKMTDEEIAKDSEFDRTVKISKDQIQLKLTSKRDTFRYKLDPSKSPAEIDISSEEAGKKSKASYGIYKVEGDTLTLFVLGADEPQLRPREFKTLNPFKEGKSEKGARKPAGGAMIVTLKRVSGDTTFISEPPPKPKPPEVDEDAPIITALTKKGFVAEKNGMIGKFGGINVTVPSTLLLDTIKELNGHGRIRSITFKKKLFTDPDHPVTGEAIQGLNKLDGLTLLVFESCPKITAAAFRDLNRFPLLTTISASDTPVDDAATEELAKLKTLEGVALRGPKLTDKSLAALAKVRTLKTIQLGDANVTAAGIKLLNALPDLETLWLQGMPVADTALGGLDLPKLASLNLAQSNITDDGLSKLPVLPALRDITLSGSKVTDASMKQFQKLPSLERLWLIDTKVTKAAEEELKKLKPKLSITLIGGR